MLPSVAGISGLMLLGLLLGALGLLYVAYAEYKEEGRGARKVRGGGEKAAGGLRRSISLSRAAGAAVAVLGHTALVEFFNLGWSLFDLLGPLVTSNILAIGVGGLGIAGVIPVDPMWYVGVMLMVFGIALSTVTDEWFERNSTRD